jgi:hypothetical protein
MKRVVNTNYGVPWDKHCSNCVYWSKVDQWCGYCDLDGPISIVEARTHQCGNWKWVVPKYFYVQEGEK